MQRVGVMLIKPVVAIKEKELFAPEHPGKGLPHHIGLIGTYCRRCDRLVKIISFTESPVKYAIKIFPEGSALYFSSDFFVSRRRITEVSPAPIVSL